MDKEQLKTILEAVLMAASSPLNLDSLLNIFTEDQRPERDELQAVLDEMAGECDTRSYELKAVNSGYRFQVKKDYADYVTRLWDDKPARYSRALLETIALIAYRQPITRGEIEAVRGVSVSSQIIKTLDERNWIKVVGHRDVPGKPSLYATTKEFLDYFNISSLDELPSLQEIRDIDEINAELDLRMPEEDASKPASTDTENVDSDEMANDNSEDMIALGVGDESDAAVAESAEASDELPTADEADETDLVAADEVDNETIEASDDHEQQTALNAQDESDGDADVEADHGEQRNAAPASAEH